ncbi:MAG: hypothetical protein IJ343_03770 [Clostridia bacterium]|nr:hypothetical protein [Clostridia bacterium]
MSNIRTEARKGTVFSEQDLTSLNAQINRRWGLIAIPCVLLLATLIASLIVRIEWITVACTILIGVILIAAGDLAIKPLSCYRRLLRNVLYGRVHEATLPFVAISEDINMVDGVPCRALTCTDYDGKNRPYERLFYFVALKPTPDFREGERVLVRHHDLIVADVIRAE